MTQYQKEQTIQLENGQGIWIDIFPKTYRWPTDIWKESQHTNTKDSTPQWDITSHILEWLPSRRLQISVGKDVEKRETYALLVGMYISAVTVENSMEVPQKFKIELLYDPAILLLGIYPKEGKKKTTLIQKDKCANVHCSIISDSQDMEAT